MGSSAQPRPPLMPVRRRLAIAAYGVVCLVVGGSLAFAPLYSSESHALAWILGGVAVGAFGVMCVLVVLPPRRSLEITDQRVVVPLRTMPAWAMVLMTLPGAVLLGYWTTRGGAGWLALPFALVLLSFAPDSLRTILRRPRLTLDQDGLRLHGWQNDAYLPSAAIAQCVRADWRGQAIVRFEGSARADSGDGDGSDTSGWHGRSHRWIWSVEPPLRAGTIEVRRDAFGDPAAHAEICARLGVPTH